MFEIVSLLNQSPVVLFVKKKGTIKRATYGSEYVAARLCVVKIVDITKQVVYPFSPVTPYYSRKIVDSSLTSMVVAGVPLYSYTVIYPDD